MPEISPRSWRRVMLPLLKGLAILNPGRRLTRGISMLMLPASLRAKATNVVKSFVRPPILKIVLFCTPPVAVFWLVKFASP